ncbi:unnamed protein product [Leuciscus chuanchicus]
MAAATPAATFTIKPLEPFDLAKPQEWESGFEPGSLTPKACVLSIALPPPTLFLGEVDSGEEPWLADINVSGHKVTFKLDSGADVSAISEQTFVSFKLKDKTLDKAEKTLYGPGGAALTVLGSTTETIVYGDRSTTEKIYVVRNLRVALLSRTASVRLKLIARVDTINEETVNKAYPKLCEGLGRVQNPYTIKLKPDAKPFSLKVPRRVPLPLMGNVKEELDRMEGLGVISRVDEPTDWCCGMVVAPKKDKEKVRICVDMTPLNESVCRERYILPFVDQTLGMLTGAQYFSKLDANMGFWQIPLSKESALLTTFITPFGRYHFNRLPFGISSAPEHFQNMMVTEVTADLKGVVCHMDDILVWGSTVEEHDKRLHAVLQRAEKASVTLNMSKCEFSKRKVKFLGFIVSADGMSPDPDKTQAVQDMKEPSNVSELRSFLGMVNQLGKFIPNLSEKDKPLRDLLSTKNMWYWGHDQQKAFHNLKQELSSPPVLQLYNPNKPQKISADASSFGLGAVMLQKEGDVWSPVAYASRSLTPTEQRYAQVEKEALALTWACERFNDFILGLHFELETDHKPLVSLLGGQALDALPPRIQRFRMRLMRYSYTIKHIPGKSLTTADTLSRLPLTNSVTGADTDFMEDTNIYLESVLEGLPTSSKYLSDLQEQLMSDSVCSQVMRYCAEGWPDRNQLQGAVKHYWPERAVLCTMDYYLGAQEILITDNGPQFACQEMKDFASEYCFEHVTSSPRYPQSNGEAERAVRTVKNLLKKASDPYRALLAYRTTALANGYSPAQLLMGRRLRTTLLMLPEALQPCVPNLRQLRHVERERRMRQTEYFNKRHRTRDLDKLIPGNPVWIADAKATGTVTSVHPTPRSYVISGPQGTIRRNRSHLVVDCGSSYPCRQKTQLPTRIREKMPLLESTCCTNCHRLLQRIAVLETKLFTGPPNQTEHTTELRHGRPQHIAGCANPLNQNGTHTPGHSMNDHRTSLQNGHDVDISHKDNDNTTEPQQPLLTNTISAEPCPQSSPQTDTSELLQDSAPKDDFLENSQGSQDSISQPPITPEQQPLSPDTFSLSPPTPLLCFSQKMEELVHAGTRLSHSFAASPQISTKKRRAPQPPKPAGPAHPPPASVRALRPLPQRQGPHPPPSARGEPKTTDTSSQ